LAHQEVAGDLMQASDITVEVRDKDLNRLGIIHPNDLDLSATEVYNNVGQWTLKLPIEHRLADALRTPGAGIIVTGPLDVLFSGPVTVPELSATPEDPLGTLTVEGVTDDIILRDYVCFPDPTNGDPTTQTKAHDIRTGPVESVMHSYVRANLGSTAAASRKKANFVNGTDLSRGPVITKSMRFQILGNLLADIAPIANLGFRVVQRGSVLAFETYQIVDRSAYIRLDIRNGQISGQKTAISPPTATRIIVAGQNEGVARQFVYRDNATSLAAEAEWGRRIERFLDQRNTDVVAELQTAGDEVLAEEGFTGVSAQIVTADDTSMIFGYHWYLGDKVSVVIEETEATSVATGMVLKVGSDGCRVAVVLGDPKDFDRNAQYTKRVQSVEQRVTQIERNVEIDNTGYLPTGAIAEFAGSSAPSGFLMCQGQAVSRTAYANLFAVIGTVYGSGDGSTTFNVPDHRDRVGVGLNTANPLMFDNLGEQGGAVSHAHSTPAHSHGLASGWAEIRMAAGTSFLMGKVMTVASRAMEVIATATNAGAATTTASTQATPLGGTTDNGGSGTTGTSSSLQPYIVFNYIIKT
jgi:microcystin-dependent protein